MTPTMKRASLAALAAAVGLALASGALLHRRYVHDLAAATARTALGSEVLATRCGPVEVQQAGRGRPLLMVHGSGGGHDQGMAFARPLTRHGIRVIAVSRFGYLRTPRPADASPQAQADTFACLLDALGLPRVAVMGVSAGGASALQMAIRHPDRVSALVLVVPIAYKPAALADAVPPLSPFAERLLMRLIGSDAVYWAALQWARNQVIGQVLATPPEQVARASAAEQARVQAMAEQVLPVSLRAAGLRDDSALGRSLGPAALDAVRAPTLVVSARDDGYGTYAPAQYTASQIAGARFLGFDNGGHLLVGHHEAVQAAIVELLQRARP
jgi:2-hydroxy-6-oxonona-2,4-dienedioate hydrolase